MKDLASINKNIKQLKKTPEINLAPSHLCAHTCFCIQVNTHIDKHVLSTHEYPNAFTKTTNKLNCVINTVTR